jgi:2-phospho-L-lactate guanylyltransferase
VWAVVPLKSPDAAKSRLQGALDGPARRRLFFAMARQVVRTLQCTPGIAGVAVVTASPEVAADVRREGAVVIPQHHEAGTADACRSAVACLAETADSLLMMSGDIPLICAAAVAELLGVGRHTPVVAIVPDRHRNGTNALLCAPPTIIPPCFGADSFERHLAAARSSGVDVHVIESHAISLDIDDVEDLNELLRRLSVESTLLPVELRAALPRKDEVLAQ